MTPLMVDERQGFVLVSRMITPHTTSGMASRAVRRAGGSPDGAQGARRLCISRSHSESLTGFKGFPIGGTVAAGAILDDPLRRRRASDD